MNCGKSPTDPEGVTFSGRVTLEFETDHSGISNFIWE
jgi:hypothetical protein